MANHNSAPLVFEIAWEVCNQIGGIYTVIRTKAPAMVAHRNSAYFLIGPYHPENAAIEFEEREAPEPIRSALEDFERGGLKAHFGHWLVPGRPQVILLDYRIKFLTLDQDKFYLWKDQQITTPQDDNEINNSIAFGFTTAEFFKILVKHIAGRKIIAHFHEWMASLAIPRIKQAALSVKTVFTTHATILGRYMASDNPRFHADLPSVDPFTAARHYNIEARFLIERAAAHGSNLFTTISEIESREAEKLLGRKPDYILPNGLNVHNFEALHELQNLHRRSKERIHEFVMGHFFPSYSFDLDNTLYLLTSGRYEYRNKGMDIYIEGLYRLNQHLKKLKNKPTVVAFIVTRAPIKSFSVGALHRHSMFEDLKRVCADVQSKMGPTVLKATATGRLPDYEELLPYDVQAAFKRSIHARKNSGLPPIVTHDMWDDNTDAVLRHLRHRGLFNQPSDPVKVIFHPDFLTATNPLFGLDYDQFVRGCHLGVFPSYYEPWGYTPLECIALGVPAVTTDLAGFGDFVLRNIPAPGSHGVQVLSRAGRSTDQCIDELASYLINFAQYTRRERIELRNRAERLSEFFDWDKLARFYHAVHDKLAAE